MALPGEARKVFKCDDCGARLPVEVLRSAAGFYIGQHCPNCGPYSRLSGYYPTRPKAEEALAKNDYCR